MVEHRIKRFADLHELLDGSSRFTIYRGQTNADWDLIPKAGRDPYSKIDDKGGLDYFKSNALPFLDRVPTNDWEWLALAQHHGVPTRLLDWTTNPMIAAFFAVVESFKTDAAIFKFTYEDSANTDKNPFEFKTVTVYKPNAVTRRIVAQQGLFTIHPKPQDAFSKSPAKGSLEKIIVTSAYRERLRHELHQYGYSYLSVFQDIQGLASYIDWRWVNRRE